MIEATRTWLLIGALLLPSGCAEEGDADLSLSTIDVGLLARHARVELDDDRVAHFELPLIDPLPAVDLETVQDTLDGAVTLVVFDPVSGAPSNVVGGAATSSRPRAPGEYRWTMPRERALKLAFVPDSAHVVLLDGVDLVAQLSIDANDVLHPVSPLTIDLAVLQRGELSVPE